MFLSHSGRWKQGQKATQRVTFHRAEVLALSSVSERCRPTARKMLFPHLSSCWRLKRWMKPLLCCSTVWPPSPCLPLDHGPALLGTGYLNLRGTHTRYDFSFIILYEMQSQSEVTELLFCVHLSLSVRGTLRNPGPRWTSWCRYCCSPLR